MTERRNIGSGAPWEEQYGYSRAVRIGQQIFVSGTTSSDETGEVVGEDEPYAQTCYILSKIDAALKDLGAGLADVVRTRTFVTDIEYWREVGRAHKEVFGENRPAATLVQVAGLIDPAMLVEIEIDAVVG